MSLDQLLIFISNNLVDSTNFKEGGRLFHKRLPRKATEFKPNVWVLVGDKYSFSPDRRIYEDGLARNISHKETRTFSI